MKHKNKLLLVVLLLLVAAFVLTKAFRSPSLESNLDTDVFTVDTAEIAALRIESFENKGMPVMLTKTDTGWVVQHDNLTARLADNQRNVLLRTLANISAERMVSRKKEKWDTYQVGDSTAVDVVIFDNKQDELAHWHIGKQSQGATYARRGDKADVYALNGQLRNEFSKSLADWRDKTFLAIKASSVEKITFNYPGDSSFVLEKKSAGWMIGDMRADSAKVEHYLGRLRSKDLTTFADDFTPEEDADVTLTIEGSTIPGARVSGWKTEGDAWVLSSSFQDGVYFRDAAFADDLFVGKKALVKE